MACPGSVDLPQIKSTGAAAERGTVVHEFLAACSVHGREEALQLVPEEHRTLCEAIAVDELPIGAEWSAEVAFAWDHALDFGRELGRDLGRNYPEHADTEYVGTADVVGLTEETVIILDYKSGWLVRAARSSWQLRLLALAAARTYERPVATVGHVKLREDGTWRLDLAVLDEFDLEAIAAELGALPSRDDLAETEECRYCPAFAACPAKARLVSGLAQVEASAEITPETAAAAYQRVVALRQVVERAEKIIDDYARQHPIVIGENRVYAAVEEKRDSLDAEKAAELLKETFGPEVARSASEFKVTKASIERAVRPALNGRKLTHVKDELLKTLAERGGVHTKRFVVMREIDREPPPSDADSRGGA